MARFVGIPLKALPHHPTVCWVHCRVQTRAADAAVGAMCSPLLDFPIDKARGVIFNIVGGLDMSLTEVRFLRWKMVW